MGTENNGDLKAPHLEGGGAIVVIKYNAGNIQSVLYALERIGVGALVTDDPEQIRSADKVIFPGVGEASSAMQYLKARGLDNVIMDLRQPVLGICLGMQLMCKYSEENDTTCLGIFDEQVKLFREVEDSLNDEMVIENNAASDRALLISSGQKRNFEKRQKNKIPQIGWNNIFDLKTDLFKDVPENSFCYFVHSYYAALGMHTIASTNYIESYSSGLHKNNFYGVQFHPEKSAQVGEKILRNFLSILPTPKEGKRNSER